MNFPSINLPTLTGDPAKDSTAIKTMANDILGKLNSLAGSGTTGRAVTIAPITTATPNYTYQLPAANGTHDVTVVKVDSGAGYVIVTAAGNDKVGLTLAQTTFTLYKQGDSVRLVDVLGGWYPISIVSGWAAYTPTFTGFGTVSAVTMWWKREGGALWLRGQWTTGTCTATEARMTLPLSLTSDATIIASIEGCGVFVLAIGAAASYYPLIESGAQYITFGSQAGATAGLTKQNGSAWTQNNSKVTLAVCQIPVSGWN